MKTHTDVALVAGLTVFASFFLIRVAFARSVRDVLIALGATLTEVGVMLMLKRHGTSIELAQSEWKALRDAIRRAASLVATAFAEVTRRKELLADVKREISEIETQHLRKDLRDANPALTKDLAIAAAKRAHAAQIAINRTLSVSPLEAQ